MRAILTFLVVHLPRWIEAYQQAKEPRVSAEALKQYRRER
jgi:hypothetical protein